MPSGFRFRKSFKIAPGIRLNISKTGASLSLGPRGAHITTGTHGTTLNLDLPGSGMYYRKKLGTKTDKNGDKQSSETEEKLGMGFFQRLVTPAEDVELIDALRKLDEGDLVGAYDHARQVIHLGDGAFLAGLLALRAEAYPEAVEYLTRALENKDNLGQHFEANEIDFSVDVPITEEITARLAPNERGVLLALAEAYQELNLIDSAINTLDLLYQHDPEGVVVRLSLAELLTEHYPDDPDVHKQIIALGENVHNVSPVHAALLYYRARALRKLGLLEGVKETLTQALRRRKGYPDDLLNALHYERALMYEATGKQKEARKELEKIFAKSPNYEDVAARLGL